MPDNSINWGSVADWVSGFGSLSAGVIALYLARASERIHLKGYVGLRLILGSGMPSVEIISISATNVGTRATVVNNIGISVGWFKSKRHGFITVIKDAYSGGVPYPLADGQQAHWGIPLGSDKQWLRQLCENFIRSESDVRSFRFHIFTNHGVKLTLKPEEAMLHALRELLAEQRSKPARSGT